MTAEDPNQGVPTWLTPIPYKTFRRRCEELGLVQFVETDGGSTRAYLPRGQGCELEIVHTGTGAGYGGRHPIEITSVRVREGKVRAQIDGVPPKALGFEHLSPQVYKTTVELLARLFAPVRGAVPIAKGCWVEVVAGKHRGKRGIVAWHGRRGRQRMATVSAPTGQLFLPVRDLRVTEGPAQVIKGMRVRVKAGEYARRLATVTYADLAKGSRIEVASLRDPQIDGPRTILPTSLWLDVSDVEVDS